MTIPSWAVRGAKVVYLGDDIGCTCAKCTAANAPPIGKVCTIEAITDVFEAPGVKIVEYPNARPTLWWRLSQFRPLITRTQEQDVAKFRELLTPSLDDLHEAVKAKGEEVDAVLRKLAEERV